MQMQESENLEDESSDNIIKTIKPDAIDNL